MDVLNTEQLRAAVLQPAPALYLRCVGAQQPGRRTHRLMVAAAITFRVLAVKYNAAAQVNFAAPSKADFRLNEHQGLRKLLGIERPFR